MYINVFEEIKQRVKIVDVCEMIGIRLDKNYKSLCPFHSEKTSSFSISTSKNIFYCFGCNRGGDCIKLVSEIYNIKPIEAAKMINDKMMLGLEFFEKKEKRRRRSDFKLNVYKEKQKIREEFKKWEQKTFELLCDYWKILSIWEENENWESELYEEAVCNKYYIDAMIDDIFINGTDEEKMWFWKNKRKEIKRIESRIRFFGSINE